MMPSRIPQKLYASQDVLAAPKEVQLARLKRTLSDPLQNINTGGSSLILRLLQLGIVGSHVRDAIFKHSNILSPLDIAHCKIVEQVEELLKHHPEIAKDGWNLAIQRWELYVGAAKTVAELSNLVFFNQSRTKFVLIDVYPFSLGEPYIGYRDFGPILQRQSVRFLALTQYLPIPKVEWIRSTYTSLGAPSLQPELFAPHSTFASTSSSLSPHIFTFTPEVLKPCLYPSELRKIDGLLALVGKEPQASVKNRIQLSEDEVDPYPLTYVIRACGNYFSQPALQTCTNCEVSIPATELHVCTGCWSILYCGQACQREHYPTHKRLCAKKEKKKE